MANTSNNKKGQDDKKYKVINLKYEYEGYEGSEKWAIISELSEKELFGLYPDEMRRYSPFVLLSVEQGKVNFNEKAPTVIVASITTVIKKRYLPSHIILGDRFGLSKPSMVLLE